MTAWYKIIIKSSLVTLRRAQKFGDSERYKIFLYNPYLHDFFRNFSQNPASLKYDAMR